MGQHIHRIGHAQAGVGEQVVPGRTPARELRLAEQSLK